ncbi:MAG: ribonuclease HII [Proteobacteria bacterium]|nr:ribonuclease HII [Desulfobacula sp.]MBU3952859.1 ribonuclease HII [Pseudomonadota bacterium]MBU4131456.1 ribonuclease HII [Pseudomonadota bacterium]
MWEFEHAALERGYHTIAGIDEAGRGPLAGPVVSAAVVLPPNFSCPGIDDSKKLSEKRRDALFPVIKAQALAMGIGMADHREIDQINVLAASLLSMKRAVQDLAPGPDFLDSDFLLPDFLLIDGKFTLDMDLPQQAIVKGDSRSISIAAASIIAKVTRDKLMANFHKTYPQYNFIRHKGYPTKAHKQAIIEYGPCPIHRTSFRGVIVP